MSESDANSFVATSQELREAAKGMSAEDIKENSNYIIENAQINDIPSDGNLKLEVVDGVAHIPVVGMLTTEVDPCSAFFGGAVTTYAFIAESVRIAEENPRVEKIRFDFNSGGGTVEGVEFASNAIFNASKPTEGVVHYMAASACYWLASQCDTLIASGVTSSVGSIGVVVEFLDTSKRDEKEGVKRVSITSTDAPLKRIDATTDAGKSVIVERLDEIHNIFISHISRGQNVSADFINENYGKGGMLIAEKALKAGMIDSIEGVSVGTSSFRENVAAVAEDHEPKTPKNEEKMGLMDYLAENPQAKAEYEKAVSDAVAQAKADTTKENQELFAKVAPIIKSEAYTETTKGVAMKVLTGERPAWALEDAVSAEDERNEKAKSEEVAENQPAETPAEDHEPEATDKAKIKAEANELGKKLGVA